MEKLKRHWNIESNFQFAIIFIVFAINGSLSARISKYFMQLLGLNDANLSWYFYYPLLFILVLPLYPFLLIGTGYLFGQHKFFFPFAKKLLKSIGLGFVFN
jgi:hypothetical protein